MKTVKIKNVSEERQEVSWIPAFAAGETKEVTEEEANRLLHNVSFCAIEVENKLPAEEKESKKSK